MQPSKKTITFEAFKDSYLMPEADGRTVNDRKRAYLDFIKAKSLSAAGMGYPCSRDEVHPMLKDHQRDAVAWAVQGGRRALFEAFGMGKTMQQLEIVRLTLLKAGGGYGLIVCPLGVRQEFIKDAAKLGTPITFVQSNDEIVLEGIYLTNYEPVRDGKLDPRAFKVVSLDEAGCLRGFGGTKTFRKMMGLFEGSGINRFVATATPSPNEFIELLAYAAFLDVMDVGQAKMRFFKRDSTKADKLTIHPHKEEEFWLWMVSWAMFLQTPSDLGYSDEGYVFPEMDIRWHEIPSNHENAGEMKNGQKKLFKDAAMGVVDASTEKRDSLDERVAKMLELRQEDVSAHRIIWHDLEDERKAIEAAIPACATVFGTQDMGEREQMLNDFSDGKIQEMATKPRIAGAGSNFQRHCAWAIFLGIGFKFHDFIQAVHRIQRFLQTKRVRIDLIYTEAERSVRHELERKWQQHKTLVAKMTEIIRKHGLAANALTQALSRKTVIDREETVSESQIDKTPLWLMANNDCVLEMMDMQTSSVDLILTSIPFATQYEYSPSYLDFGHTNDTKHFFEQNDFATPEMLRVLQPGRVMCIHVKDRIVPGGLTGLGFQTVQPFHAECIAHYLRHGFAYLGMKTIVTDVVRENNQTYRLGWTEQCKDGSRMGCGMPEYMLIFRKPPTDSSDGYADVPVVKHKGSYEEELDALGKSLGLSTLDKGYSRPRWQFDAHGFIRSSGNRLLTGEDLAGLSKAQIFQAFKRESLSQIYDHESVVKLAEIVDAAGMLPTTFMLLQPQSWSPEVWTDITRMRTLNGVQKAKGKETHICPMQFDTANRCITQYSMKGELVLDPFAGLGTVPMCALRLGRRGRGVELAPNYYNDALWHLRQAERGLNNPTLFELEEDIEAVLIESEAE